MFITKKHLSRRTVLRGVGVSLGLPLLDSMVAAQTPLSKTAAAPKKCFIAIEIVHGSAGSTVEGRDKHYWMPPQEGRDFEFSFSLKPLEPFRDYVTVISNTDASNAEAKTPQEKGADHFRSSAVLLSGAHPRQTEGSDVECGTTIDQIYARQYGQDNPLPSIQLCIENVAASGSCDFHYSCVYRDTISWSSPTTPLPMTVDPRMAFESLFGDGSDKDLALRQKENKSILDAIMADTVRLQNKIDATDRARLSNYLDNVREVERRIEATEKYNAANPNRELPAAPGGVPDSWEQHVRLMFDLQVLAFTADVTRVSAMKLSSDLSERVFPESGVPTPFHTASHHKDSPARIAEYATLNRYHVGILAYFVDRLKNTPDGNGNLLDHSLLFYGSPMGDSNVHAHKSVPLVLVGHASGAIKGNLHVRAKDGTPHSNALLAVINRLGVDQNSIGDSTGAVSI